MTSTQQVLHIAGWSSCGFYKRASNVVGSLSLLFPNRLKVVDHKFKSRTEYREWLIDGGFRTNVPDERAHEHSSSPFAWLSESPSKDPDVLDIKSFIGGHDDTLEWCRKFCSPNDDEEEEEEEGMVDMVDDGHVNGKQQHGYDYDLIVIGGGSGGLACSKEASKLGAKVAVLDFVKPSPFGTSWGLGGTCVNVGCIPKKLMHNAALINESIHADSDAFGIVTPSSTPTPTPTKAEDDRSIIDRVQQQQQHNWEKMRENVQNHIRGLNFKYRVNLREENVVYLNKLGKFIDNHTLEVVDKKGRVTQITSSRFVIAVGGRPTTLNCVGNELSISSDDIFALTNNPGKVLCVGASYISLECGGFLAGLGYDVTIAVRSILLRGFDRECSTKIGEYMEDFTNVKFKREVVPTKLEKIDVDSNSNDNDNKDDGNKKQRIKVTFSDESSEVYDTVLVAIGRSADTDKLGLDVVNVQTNTKNGKIICKHEQTSTPNIYAIGDVMDGIPELTPVAIEAGLHLARRLFGKSSYKEGMDYKNVCTTVFTPIEYGTVGLSEEEAIDALGEDGIEIYHKSFYPLEWSLSPSRQNHQAFTKVIVDKLDDKVLGIHYVGPNAGEIMQGYGVAMKMNNNNKKSKLTFKQLIDTVGIHPTSSEEIVTLSVTKSSGKSAAAGGC